MLTEESGESVDLPTFKAYFVFLKLIVCLPKQNQHEPEKNVCVCVCVCERDRERERERERERV
jgi:hypothetical protein